MSPAYEPLTPADAAVIGPETQAGIEEARRANVADILRRAPTAFTATASPSSIGTTEWEDFKTRQGMALADARAGRETVTEAWAGPADPAQFTQNQRYKQAQAAGDLSVAPSSRYTAGNESKRIASQAARRETVAERQTAVHHRAAVRAQQRGRATPTPGQLDIMAKIRAGTPLSPAEITEAYGVKAGEQAAARQGAERIENIRGGWNVKMAEAQRRGESGEWSAEGMYYKRLGNLRESYDTRWTAAIDNPVLQEEIKEEYEADKTALKKEWADRAGQVSPAQPGITKPGATKPGSKPPSGQVATTPSVSPLKKVQLRIAKAEGEGGIANVYGLAPDASVSAVQKVRRERWWEMSPAAQEAFSGYVRDRLAFDLVFRKEYHVTSPASWGDIAAGVEKSVFPGPARIVPWAQNLFGY